MKGVDAIGPMLEPQATEGSQAKTKDGKQFDAVLAEVIEKDPARPKGATLLAPASDKASGEGLPASARSLAGTSGQLAAARDAAAQAVPAQAARAAPEGAVTSQLDALEAVEEPERELEEPKTAQQDQVVLGQIASVVARIVAPPPSVQAPKQEVAATREPKLTQPALPSPAPANDVLPLVRAQEFHDALHGVQIVPHDSHDVHEALTVRPGASESTPPAEGEEQALGPIGRALQALKGDGAPMRAAADKVMNAFRALSGREQAPTVPTPTTGAAAPAQMANTPAWGSSTAPGAAAIAGAPTHTIAVAGNAAPAQTPVQALAAPVEAPVSPPATPEMPTVRPGALQTTPSRGQAQTITVSAPDVAGRPMPEQPAVQPVGSRSVSGQPASGQSVDGQPVPGQPVSGQRASAPLVARQPVPGQPVSEQPMPGQPVPGQPVPGQPVQRQAQALEALPPEPPPRPEQAQLAPPQPAHVTPQPQAAPGHATQPVVVQVQPQPEAVSEEAAREQPAADKSEGEARERVHGFARGGWTDQARSAYGGRGHEGSSDRGGHDRGDTARTVEREEERATERAGEQAAPQFLGEQLVPEPQLTQAPHQAQETSSANVPQNQPAAPAAPVQELPDIVFQGRPDPTAASENASISLHHPDLGPIQLEVRRELGRVEVHAVIESQHAQAVLRANENGIRQGVQQAGMTFNALRVRVRGEEQPSNHRPGQERRRRSNERET